METIQPKDQLQAVLSDPRVIRPPLHIALFLLALALRLIFVYQFYWHPLFEMLPVDTHEFNRQALAILNGSWLDPDAVFVNPLYPLLLASHFAVFGVSFLPVIFIQAILDALSCLLVAHIGAGLFSAKTGLAAGLLYAFYGTAVFYSGVLLVPTVLTFTTLCFLSTLLRAGRRPQWNTFVGAGVLFGIILLGAPNIAIFLLVLPVWFWLRFEKQYGIGKTSRWFFVLVAGTCAVLSLAAVRNYMITGQLLPFPVHGGVNFYMGNHPGAEGYFMRLPSISSRPVEQVITSIRLAEEATGKSLTPSAASRYWLLKGLEFWKDRPGDAIAVYLKKTALFWRREELPLNVSYYFTRQHLPFLRLPFISFGLIAPLGLMGIWLSIRNRQALLPALYLMAHTIAVLLFFVSARYRFPITPLLAIYAAAFVAKMLTPSADGRRSVRTRRFCATALLIVGINYPFAYFTYLPVDKFAYDYGNILYQKKRFADAQREFAKVVAQNPNHVDAHYRLGQCFMKQRRYAEAAAQWERVLRLDSTYPGIREKIDGLPKRGMPVHPP